MQNFFVIFFPLLETTSNFKHFKTNMVVRTNEFPKLQTVKNLDRSPCKKRRFGTRFDSQHLKESQTLAKTP